MSSEWTKEQIQELLRRENFTYQRIELPYGLSTSGEDRSATARAIFPESLKGKSVLDLGCNNGFFCYEAARRGATRVVGLDVDPDMIRKNRILAEILGHDVEFNVMDLDRERITERFDYVLCLNVLHHLRYPLYTLDNLVEVVREKLVLEMASFGLGDSIRMGVFPALSPLIANLPVIFVSPGHARKKLKRFVFTQSAMRNLLLTHRRVFSSCKTAPSEFKSRYLLTAEKHDIEHLVVVAGPSGMDRQAFIRELAMGKHDAVSKALDTTLERAVILPSPSDQRAKVALLGYDILNPFMRTGNVYSRDVELDLLSVARQVSFVTLKPDAAQLAKAYEGDISKGRIFSKPSKRQRRILESYRDAASYQKHFDAWQAYLRQSKARHVTAVFDNRGQLASVN